MSFPPPLWLTAGLAAVLAIAVIAIVRRFGRDTSDGSTLRLVLAIIFAVSVANFADNLIWKWLITPVAVRLDDGSTGFGRWDVDRQGNGTMLVTVGDVTCTHRYNGRNPERYVQSGFSCNGRYMGVSRVIRDGSRGWMTRGTGAFRLRDPDAHLAYGWFVFGPSARLAVLTGGRFGLPDGTPDKAAFDQVDVDGRKVQAGG